MDRCDDDVELSEAVVGEIEPAIGQDVAFDSGEQREILESAVQRPDAGGVFERPSLVEAVGHRERLAVIGDGDVLAAEAMRGLRHRRQVVAAISLRRVHVQIATQIGQRDQCRQRPARAASTSPRFSRSSGSIQSMPSAR